MDGPYYAALEEKAAARNHHLSDETDSGEINTRGWIDRFRGDTKANGMTNKWTRAQQWHWHRLNSVDKT